MGDPPKRQKGGVFLLVFPSNPFPKPRAIKKKDGALTKESHVETGPNSLPVSPPPFCLFFLRGNPKANRGHFGGSMGVRIPKQAYPNENRGHFRGWMGGSDSQEPTQWRMFLSLSLSPMRQRGTEIAASRPGRRATRWNTRWVTAAGVDRFPF